jgi:hypothetical protein
MGSMGSANSGQALYLFSSNSRPLYTQDVLNVLAAPAGMTYAFRYRRDWVAAGLREAWAGNDLVGRQLILHFSLQQPNQYLPATLIPLRMGTVVETTVEAGTIHLVQFTIGSDVTLVSSAEGDFERREQAQALEVYRSYLKSNNVGAPPDAWAGHGPDVTSDPTGPLRLASDEGEAFTRTVRLLGGTSTYERATFFRLARIAASPSEKDVEDPAFDAKEGYRLRSARAYQVVVLQSQPGDAPSIAGFALDASESVARFVGRPRFEISSKYDVIPLPLIAADVGAEVQRRTGVIGITPEEGVQGPRLAVPITVEMEGMKKVTATVTAVAAVALAGLASMVANLNPLAVLLLVSAAVLSAWLSIRIGGKIPLAG